MAAYFSTFFIQLLSVSEKKYGETNYTHSNVTTIKTTFIHNMISLNFSTYEIQFQLV